MEKKRFLSWAHGLHQLCVSRPCFTVEFSVARRRIHRVSRLWATGNEKGWIERTSAMNLIVISTGERVISSLQSLEKPHRTRFTRDRVYARVKTRSDSAFTNQNAKIARSKTAARSRLLIRATLKPFAVSRHANTASADVRSLDIRQSARRHPVRRKSGREDGRGGSLTHDPLPPLPEPAIHHVGNVSSRPRVSRDSFVILPKRALRPLFSANACPSLTRTSHWPGFSLPLPRRPWIQNTGSQRGPSSSCRAEIAMSSSSLKHSDLFSLIAEFLFAS